MKANLIFYHHYTDSHTQPGMRLLRLKYGWAGEGKYYALLNMIGSAENCELNISKKYNLASCSEILGFSIDEFRDFVDYLVKECELLTYTGINVDKHVDKSWITNHGLKENLSEIMRKRMSARQRKRKNDISSLNS